MSTITISQKLIKNDDLIIIPRKEFEQVLRMAKEKQYGKFDKQLNKIIEEVKQGKVIGPFNSVKSLRSSLEK